MQKTLFVASLLIFAAFSFSTNEEELNTLWSAWKAQHRKGYTSTGEDSARFAIFADNYKKILKFNAENETPKLALNHFADLTGAEFTSKHSGCAFFEDDEDLVKANTLEFNQNQEVPNSVDWREKGAVTPVKDQAQCGSCWAFSSTGVLEGFHALNNGQLVSFSEQQIVDCDNADYGCNGGWPYLALEYAAQGGVETESDYPYKGRDQTCSFSKDKAVQTNSGYSFVTTKSSDALKTALASMPVSVAIEADQSVFQFYSSGVIKSGCGSYLNHAVLAVGFTTVSGTEAFIVKNSWGTSWGDKGYVYISTDGSANAGAGVCGILSQPVVPK